MALTALQRNPFMLMMHPEAVLAAIEKSAGLEQLNRHLCRPLDRLPGAPGEGGPEADEDKEDTPIAAQ